MKFPIVTFLLRSWRFCCALGVSAAFRVILIKISKRSGNAVKISKRSRNAVRAKIGQKSA